MGKERRDIEERLMIDDDGQEFVTAVVLKPDQSGGGSLHRDLEIVRFPLPWHPRQQLRQSH